MHKDSIQLVNYHAVAVYAFDNLITNKLSINFYASNASR